MAIPPDTQRRTRLYCWRWAGTSTKGRKLHGELVAASRADVKKSLINQKVIATRISRKRFSHMGRITSHDIMLFTRQMATMIRAGIPILQAFKVVADSQKKPVMSKLIKDLMHDVAAGINFAEALSRHPKHFDRLLCSLVDAGEQSGALDIMLERIASYKESHEALRRNVRKAMVYPLAVVIVGVCVTALLLIKVVPQFEALFSGFGAELPAMTRITITLSETAQTWWPWCIALLTAGVLLFLVGMRHSAGFACRVHRVALKLPVLGTIISQSAVARYARTLATTFGAGVPLVEALNTASGVTGNRAYEKAVIHARDEVSGGQQLHTAMRMSGQFPALAIQMVGIGEEAGALDTMLSRIADYYEDEVNRLVDTLTTLLEPFILVFLGGMVGFLVISMYLPIFELGGSM